MTTRPKTRALHPLLLGACAFGLSVAAAPASWSTASAQAAKPVKLALVTDLTGASAEEARQTELGMRSGLEYATAAFIRFEPHQERSSAVTAYNSALETRAHTGAPARLENGYCDPSDLEQTTEFLMTSVAARIGAFATRSV